MTIDGRFPDSEGFGARAPLKTTNQAQIVAAKKKESFELVEPNAADVQLVGDFTGWEQNPIALKRQKDGCWKATVPLEPGQHE